MLNRRLLSLVVTVGLVMGLSSLAMAGIPDGALSTVSAGTGVIMICPLGDGDALSDKGLTIAVQIVDGSGTPIPGYPGQDIWVDDALTGDINLCQGGSAADADTDANGETTISGVIAGGGWTQSGVSAYVGGVVIEGGDGPILGIDVNSPDNTGNRVVDLGDTGNFASDLLEPVAPFRSDLVFDNVINLSDVGRYASHIGHACQ